MLKLMFIYMTAVVLLWGGIFASADNMNKDISVSNAWVQAMPPSQTTSAAYMVITNNAGHEAVLVSASSDIAATTEIHQMSEMNGMMDMARLPSIRIPAMGKLALKPGGYHLMLIDLKKPAAKGGLVSITLHFQDGTETSVNAPIGQRPQEDPSSMAGMNM